MAWLTNWVGNWAGSRREMTPLKPSSTDMMSGRSGILPGWHDYLAHIFLLKRHLVDLLGEFSLA